MLVESVFEYKQPIPIEYTCEGRNISPPLQLSGVPEQADSLVLIMDDPDAPKGTFDHWILWNISPKVTTISEGAEELFGEGSEVKRGTNSYGELDYRGPCPPPGKPHRYFFKLYALDTHLSLKEGVSKHDVEKAMEGHVIDQAELVGTYQRN